MPISFDAIPTTIRVPFVGVEFNASRAQQGPAILPYKAVHIGQKLTAGAWAADSVNRATSVDQVIAGAGRGSISHRQAIGWFAANKTTEAWFAVVADNGAGVAATGTIVVGGPATAAGSLYLYLGAERITVGVALNDASTAIATAIAAAINANTNLPVTATAATSTVTILFRHKGLAGNTYDVRANFRDGEVNPTGVTLTITAMGGVIAGTLNPVLTGVIAAMSDLWFQIWSHPYTDATSLSAIEAELLARFGPMVSMDGIAITSASGSFSTLSALGLTRNSAQSVIVAQPGQAQLNPPMEFAAGVAGLVALAAAADPGRPFQTLALPQDRFLAPAETDQWSLTERNLFLFAGIATTKRAVGGIVQLERVITTYRLSPGGSDDTSYLDATTMLTLLYLRYSFRNRIQTRYPRHKLAGDDVLPGAGQAVITPMLGKGEALAWFDDMLALLLVENIEQFKRDLVCERDLVDPNRLNWLLPPDLINQLVVAAAQIQFRL